LFEALHRRVIFVFINNSNKRITVHAVAALHSLRER